jgi:hypothetical protein
MKSHHVGRAALRSRISRAAVCVSSLAFFLNTGFYVVLSMVLLTFMIVRSRLASLNKSFTKSFGICVEDIP